MEAHRLIDRGREASRVRYHISARVRSLRQLVERPPDRVSRGREASEDDIESGVHLVVPGAGFSVALYPGEEHVHDVAARGFLAPRFEKVLEVDIDALEGGGAILEGPKGIGIDVLEEAG